MRFPPRPPRPRAGPPLAGDARSPGGPLRALRGPRRALYWALATVLATAAVLLALRPVLDGGDGGDSPHRGVGAAAHRTAQAQAPATPTPDGEDFPAPPRGDRGKPLPDPRTVPAVRSYERADGTGWRPADRAVVIAEDDALTDESKRLAA